MKRIILFLTVAFAALIFAAVPALAAEGEQIPSNVTITIVMPDGVEKAQQDSPPLAPVPAAPALYPTGVEEIREDGLRHIVKTYELDDGENPASISREGFERLGWHYELTDVMKAETAGLEAREHTETVTLNTDTKDLQTILGLLAPTLDFKSEDGYVGILALNISSVKVEQAGTKTSTYGVSATREYPRLSESDTSLVPKTITDGGRTLRLADVEWRADNLVTVDYEQLPEYYTAVATYTGTGSKTVVTGYVTTAEYAGTLTKLNQGKTVYTAYFLGTEIVPERTPLEVMESTPTPKPDPTAAPETTPTATDEPAAVQTDTNPASPAILITLAIILALLVGAAAGRFITRRKNMINGKDVNL
jgi:hypothetical protein